MKRHIFLNTILLILSLGALALPAMATSGEYCEILQSDGTDNCEVGPGPGPNPIQCPDGTMANSLEDCPQVPCSDGSTVPNGQTCPPIQCHHSGPVPDGEECPPHQCPDGTTLLDNVPCPPVLCPDGTKLPNGQHCPKPDLTGKLSVSQMSNQVASVTVRVTNTGTAPALSAVDGGYIIDVGLFSSASSKVTIAGTKKVQIKTTNTLIPGSSETFQVDIPLTSNLLLPQKKVIVCADIDPEKSVQETNEDNNRTCQAI